jgi:hypothetical protein
VLTVLAGTAASVVVGRLMVTRLPVPFDTTWFFQVLRRVRSGEALYRDVFFGAGPLPVWLARAATAVGADQVRTLRRLHGAVFVLTTCAILLTVEGAAGARTAACLVAPLLGLSGLVWPGDNLYGQLSRLGAATTAAALVLGGSDPGAAALVVAAAGAAVACLAKYTLGVVAVAVAAASLALTAGPGPAFAFLALTALALAPAVAALLRQGIVGPFVQRAVRNKRTFVATGTVRPLEGLRPYLPGRAQPPLAWLVNSVVVVGFVLFAVAPLGLVVGVVQALVDPARRPEAGALALLAAVGLSSAVPRTDSQHVTGAAPLLLAATALAARAVSGPVSLAVDLLLLTAGLTGLAVALAHWRGPGRLPVSSAPPWTGVPGPALPVELLAAGRDLSTATGGVVFLLRPDAATWYLACDLRNPTPYDYPLASTFGPSGQEEVVGDLRAGRITWCCFAPADAGPLTPVVLEEFVQRELVPVGETALGTLYRSPAC